MVLVNSQKATKSMWLPTERIKTLLWKEALELKERRSSKLGASVRRCVIVAKGGEEWRTARIGWRTATRSRNEANECVGEDWKWARRRAERGGPPGVQGTKSRRTWGGENGVEIAGYWDGGGGGGGPLSCCVDPQAKARALGWQDSGTDVHSRGGWS